MNTGSNNSTAPVIPAAAKVEAEPLEEDEEDDDPLTAGLTGEAKCKTRFWRCVGKVVKEGSHYLQEPGGVTK